MPSWQQTNHHLAPSLFKVNFILTKITKNKKKLHLTEDMWKVTGDTWHMKCDKWHMIHGVVWTFSLNFSSLGKDLKKANYTYFVDKWRNPPTPPHPHWLKLMIFTLRIFFLSILGHPPSPLSTFVKIMRFFLFLLFNLFIFFSHCYS